MKHILLFVLFVFVVANFSFAQELRGAAKKSVLKHAKPLVSNMLKGFDEGSYKKYTKHFNAKMKKFVTPAFFAKQQKAIQAKIGRRKSHKAYKVIASKGHNIVIYYAQYTKEKDVEVRVAIEKGKKSIGGHWFSSIKLMGPEVSKAKRKAVVKYSTPMLSNLFAGLNENNYKKYSKNFGSQMKKALSKDAFNKARKMIIGAVGKYKTRKLAKVLQRGKYVTVVHRVDFAKEKGVVSTSTFTKEKGKHVLAGHVLNSPKLRAAK